MTPDRRDKMPEMLQWSSALLALLGLILWFWSGGLYVPQTAGGPHPVARLKRQIRRAAIFAAIASALLQAAAAPSLTERHEVELWASAAPAPTALVG
jgi:hypothetical protein